MKKLLPITLIALGAALGITGCGTIQATGEIPARAHAQAQVPSTDGPAPIDAAIVTPGFGWVLTAEQLLVTRDGGTTFTDVQVPLPVTRVRAAFFRDAQNGYVTASTGGVITTARTNDGGRTWQTGTVRDASAPAAAYGRLRMAFGNAGHGVILAQTSTSAMSSTATLFATTDGGSSWSARSAPVSGDIAMEPRGRIWLAGGVAADKLYSSVDQGRHWTGARLQVRGTVASKAVAPPVDGVVPVTVVTTSDRTDVALLTSPDQGRTWVESNRVTVRGKTGAGVRVPVTTAGSRLLVLDTAGGHAYGVPANGTTTDLRPSGLSEGTHTVTFAPDARTGWALATYGRCAGDKTDCALYNPLMTTTDGGATWQQVRMWRQQLN